MTKNQRKFLGIALLVVGFVGVLLSPSAYHPMVGMMQYMTNAQLPRGITATRLPEENSKEVELLEEYCTQCHGLPAPGMHTRDEWPLVVTRMSQYLRTMHTFHINKPSSQELLSIQNYLQRHAQQAMDRNRYNDLDTPAGQAFLNTCTQCHAAPGPSQHTATEWPHVVQRMIQNMNIMGKNIPGQDQEALIIEYLKKHSQ